MNKEETINRIKESLQKMDGAIQELEAIQESIKEFGKLSGDEDILAPISNGIFVEASLKNNKTLKINIGDGVIVDKTIPEAQELIKKQISEINKSKEKAVSEYNKVKNV